VSRRRIFVLVVTPAVLALAVLTYQYLKAPDSVPAAEAHAMIEQDSTILLLDVRTAGEFTGESGPLADAVNIPVEDLARRVRELDARKGALIIAYCRSGRRSRNAASLLSAEGFRVLNMEGGILSWTQAGFPVMMGSSH